MQHGIPQALRTNMNASYKEPSPPMITSPPPTSSDSFKIEAVVICSDYSDFLRHTLPQNKFLFDRIVVVTSYEDKATRRMCEFHHVECLPTDRLNVRKGEFCKGCGINDGLARLSMGGWVVHMDADIWLPPQTRILLEQAEARPIYGVRNRPLPGSRHRRVGQVPGCAATAA